MHNCLFKPTAIRTSKTTVHTIPSTKRFKPFAQKIRAVYPIPENKHLPKQITYPAPFIPICLSGSVSLKKVKNVNIDIKAIDTIILKIPYFVPLNKNTAQDIDKYPMIC